MFQIRVSMSWWLMHRQKTKINCRDNSNESAPDARCEGWWWVHECGRRYSASIPSIKNPIWVTTHGYSPTLVVQLYFIEFQLISRLLAKWMDINNFPRDGIIVGIFINKLYYISCHEFMLLLLFTEKE